MVTNKEFLCIFVVSAQSVGKYFSLHTLALLSNIHKDTSRLQFIIERTIPMSAQIEHKLRSMNEKWVEALVKKDTSTLAGLMHDRCIFTDALTGDDKAQFIADIESGALAVNSLTRDNVEVSIYGSTGILTALDSCDWLYKEQHIQGHYRTTHVYAEQEGVWQIVAIQASHIEFK
jgi:ketosteroid isomerase-like protein